MKRIPSSPSSVVLSPSALLCNSLAFVLLFSLSTSAVADTYRWVDANGVVNYAERAPRGVPSSQVTRISADKSSNPSSTANSPSANQLATPTGASSGAATSRVPNRDNLSAQQQEMLDRLESAEQERQTTLAQLREQNCQRSRDVLANLSSRGKIRVVLPDGTEQTLPEEERQRRIQMAQQGIVENCNS